MPLLAVEGLSQAFGGLTVVDNVSFSLEAGDIVALIGPNGAGKTTLINLLSGMLPAQHGRIHLLGHDITHLPPDKRVVLGLARSFQVDSLFPNMSLLTNVLLAVQGTKRMKRALSRPIAAYTDNIAEAQRLLELVALWPKKDETVNILSHGERRLVEIILALASKPRLLMLDEPNAGLSSSETLGIIEIIRNLGKDTTVFFCAHDMDMVFTLAERVIVLYYGKIIADGKPQEIQNNSRVKEIYLGRKA